MDVRDVSRRTGSGLEVDLLVSPRSNRSGVDGIDEWRRRLIVRVRAPPLDGRANKEIEELFTSMTGSRSEIVSGHLNRQKTLRIYGDPDGIQGILGPAVVSRSG